MCIESILRLPAVLLIAALLSTFTIQDGLAHGDHDIPCQGPHKNDDGCAGDPGGGELPVGAVIMWVTDDAPDGWLLCDGGSVLQADYPALFDVIGVTYGDGGSNDTFNLPDLRGRFPLGQDDMGGTSADRVIHAAADELAGASGFETIDTRFNGFSAAIALTAAQSGSAAHTHDVNASDATGGSGNKVALHRNASNTATISNAATSAGGLGAAAPHDHPIAGGEANQEVMNPYVVMNFIIKL
jgi:microcystin-dependent protein